MEKIWVDLDNPNFFMDLYKINIILRILITHNKKLLC